MWRETQFRAYFTHETEFPRTDKKNFGSGLQAPANRLRTNFPTVFFV